MCRLNIFLLCLVVHLNIKCTVDEHLILKRVNYYLGINVPAEQRVDFLEHKIIEGYEYPKSVYIAFSCKNPDSLVKELDLLPSDRRLNNKSLRVSDYEYANLINGFWRMGSTKETRELIAIENKTTWWWKPNFSSSSLTYGAFYNEFKKKRIVSSTEQWTGRLVFQAAKGKVYIQIDLFEGR